MNNNRTPQSPSQENIIRERELGLSLRLQPERIHEHDREEDTGEKKEEMTASLPYSVQNKVQQLNNHLAGISSHVNSPMPNRKARVSVRAKCQAATVSILISHSSFLARDIDFHAHQHKTVYLY